MRVVKADDYQTWFIEENDYGVLIDPWLDKKLNPENSVLLQRERKEASSLSQEEFIFWAAYYDIKHDEEKRELNRQKANRL